LGCVLSFVPPNPVALIPHEPKGAKATNILVMFSRSAVNVPKAHKPDRASTDRSKCAVRLVRPWRIDRATARATSLKQYPLI